MKLGLGKIARLALVAGVLALLALFASRVEWPRLWTSVRAASLSLLVAAALVHVLSVLLKGLRWWVFLRPIGARSLALAVRATFAGAGLNNLLVANGGEAARVLFVAREARSPVERVLATLAVERLFEMVGFALLLVAAALFLRLPPQLAGIGMWAVATLLGFAGCAAWLVRRRSAGHIEAPPRRGRFAGRLHGLWTTMRQVCSTRRAAAAFALTIGVWTLQVVTYHLTARATHLEMPIAATVAALLAANLGFAFRATPGGVGVFQALYVAGAAAYGVDPQAAVATALLLQAQQVLPVTVLCLLLAPGFLLRERPLPGPAVAV